MTPVRRVAVIAGRVLASGALVTGAVTFLVSFGPRAMPAYADIYAPLVSATGFLAPPPGGGPPVRFGQVLVNGQSFQYAIGHSKLRLDDVLTHYEAQFKVSGAGSGRPIVTAARISGVGAGVVTGIRFGSLAHPQDVSDNIQRFTKSTQLNDFGQFHVISAYSQKGTVFVDFTPGDDVRINTLLPTGTSDAPGEDVPGVRRPSGLQRLMTVEHGEGATQSRTLVYRASDSSAAVNEFRSAFMSAGWTASALVGSPAVSHYSDGRSECFIGGEGLDNSSVVIVVYRRLFGVQRQS